MTDETNKIVSRAVDGDTTQPAYQYDAAGNLTDDGAQTYTYDAWNRVVWVTRDGGKSADTHTSYSYDALGRRIERYTGDGPPVLTDHYYYDGSRLIEQRDAAGSLERQYVWGLDYVDEQVAQYHDGATSPHLVMQDANYNVVGLTNASGAVSEQYSYEPYGDLFKAENGAGQDIDLTTPQGLHVLSNQHLHQGLAYDPDTNLYHNRARAYNPKLGRFMQRDPNRTGTLMSQVLARNAESRAVTASLLPGRQYSDGMSLYAAARGNPQAGRDPSGRQLIADHLVPDISYGTVIGWYLEAAGFTNLDIGKCRNKVYEELGDDYNQKTGKPGTVKGETIAWSYIHCVIHCAFIKNYYTCGGQEYSKFAGAATEYYQTYECEKLKGIKAGIDYVRGQGLPAWATPDPMSRKDTKRMYQECESAFQFSDYYDNQTGRNCGSSVGKEGSCSSCCEGKLQGKTRGKLPEGPDSRSRPYGPHHPDDRGPGWPENPPKMPEGWGPEGVPLPK